MLKSQTSLSSKIAYFSHPEWQRAQLLLVTFQKFILELYLIVSSSKYDSLLQEIVDQWLNIVVLMIISHLLTI